MTEEKHHADIRYFCAPTGRYHARAAAAGGCERLLDGRSEADPLGIPARLFRNGSDQAAQERCDFVAADYAPTSYDKVVVEPVEWYAPERNDKTKEKLKANFHSRLVERLSTKYRVVDASEAGPGTLRVRSAITGTRPARWYLNLPAQAAQLALGGIGLFRPSAGGASEEMQIQDAVSGRPLVQVATFRNGKPWHVSGSYVPYDHARGAFTEASKLLTEVATTPDASRVAAAKTPDATQVAVAKLEVASAPR